MEVHQAASVAADSSPSSDYHHPWKAIEMFLAPTFDSEAKNHYGPTVEF
jgi:hypothetical protein